MAAALQLFEHGIHGSGLQEALVGYMVVNSMESMNLVLLSLWGESSTHSPAPYGAIVVVYDASPDSGSEETLMLLSSMTKDLDANLCLIAYPADRVSVVMKKRFDLKCTPWSIFQYPDSRAFSVVAGYDAPGLVQALAELNANRDIPKALKARTVCPLADYALPDVVRILKVVLTACPAVLVIKGSPERVYCRNSIQALQLLWETPFASSRVIVWNMLESPVLQCALKSLKDENGRHLRFPQLFMRGIPSGDCTKLLQLSQAKELEAILTEAVTGGLGMEDMERLLLDFEGPVALIVGTEQSPLNGPSRRCIEIIKLSGATITYVDINKFGDIATRLDLRRMNGDRVGEFDTWQPSIYSRGKYKCNLTSLENVLSRRGPAALIELINDH